MNPNLRYKALTIATAALLLQACGGGGSGVDERTTYLNVSVDNFYFGTRDVGSVATQKIELANWSADKYPINHLTVTGDNSDEFKTNFPGHLVLNPSEKVMVDVSFAPLTDGLKSAEISIDYDVIAQATAAQNEAEQHFYQARSLEQKENYTESRDAYQTYLNSDPVTINKSRAAIKLPVLSETELYGSGDDFNSYITAVNQRDEGDLSAALASLDAVPLSTDDSYYADDALYLKGYIQLIDEQDYEAARETMAQFQQDFPDSTYMDSAIYSEALALEELGELEAAVELYQELIDRHRSDAWAKLNLNVAKDNIISRLWFERANDGLTRIESA